MLVTIFIISLTVVVTRTELKGYITIGLNAITLAATSVPVQLTSSLSYYYSRPLSYCLINLRIGGSLTDLHVVYRTAVRSISFPGGFRFALHFLFTVELWLHCDHYGRICKAFELRIQQGVHGFCKRTKTFRVTLGLQCGILITMGNENEQDTDPKLAGRKGTRTDVNSLVHTEEQLRDPNYGRRQVNDVNVSEHDSYSELMKKYEDRFNKLKESCFRDLSSVSISNSGWETGRPKAVIADNLKGDAANIFTRPSIDALLVRNTVPESNNMATAEELARISAKVQALGAPEEHLAEVFWDVAKYCATAGSSPAVNPQGTIQLGGRTITRDMVFAVIKEYSTLRRVCRSYAPITWNNMLLNNQPPANWDAKGFTEDTKFAAFDVFDAVTNKAAIQPLEGLIRHPTQAERIAYATHKKLALEKSAQNSRYANTSAEVTGGLFGCSPRNNFRESRC
ncbi:CP [Garlic yellow virus]|nr:CP [Garlic yellow virus]